MSLRPGTRIGSYEIAAQIGVGGMGEVYRATDTNLKRAVAIKVLPASVSTDALRVARFQREAEALAALNHPNIAQIHGLDTSGGRLALVMELVEGPTLADRIAQGPVPVDDALAIARQLVDALDAAHTSGIVHRDLKPANIKVRADGSVKVLDFGLAKLEPAPETHMVSVEPGVTDSPTAIPLATQPGMVLGTPAYMAPEQARGAAVDTRVDIWAFGVVVFEMVTARPLYGRQTLADTIAAVLHDEPDWTLAPAAVQRLVRSCLQKDPKHRLRDIADARLLIDERPSSPAAAGAPAGRVGWAAAALFALVAAAAWGPWRTTPAGGAPFRFQITPAVSLAASSASAISPNGRHLAYIGTGSDGVQRIWIRDLDSLVDRPLPGSEVRGSAPPPFWSPDSRFIAFDGGGLLKKVGVSGGLAQKICELRSPAIGGSWNRDGTIIFGSANGPIMRVHESGGTPVPITALDASQGETMHLLPVFLPDGRRFLYLRASQAVERAGIFAGSIDLAPDAQDRRRLVATPTGPVYAPRARNAGTLLFLRDGNLMAQAFDEGRVELSGEPDTIIERVDSYRDGATVSASTTGVLVYRSTTSLRLIWLDRPGRIVERGAEHGLYETLTLSADGTRALVSAVSPVATSSDELWLFDFARHTSGRLTPEDARDGVWSSDSRRVVFETGRGLIQRVLATQQEDVLLSPAPVRRSPTSWSPDGRFLLFTMSESRTGSDIWALSMEGKPEAVPFLRSSAAESQAQFSRRAGEPLWVAYTSNESGRDDVFVRTFPDARNVQLVSRNGGHSPRWRGDGAELFYVTADGMIMAAAFDPRRGAGTPETLFPAPRGFASRDATFSRSSAPWAVTPDGERFVFAAPDEAGALAQFTVVVNWTNGTDN